jgi:hypothetical protein
VILEMLEWCITPSTWLARRSGLLAEQIAIRYRGNRCRKAWKPHLDACKSFVARNANTGGHVVILGSGHLNDVDWKFLNDRFDKITLVDVVHPLEIQCRAFFSKRRIKLVASDVTGLISDRKNPPSICGLLSEADVALSICLLSQLALPFQKRWQDLPASERTARAHKIFEEHLAQLRSVSKALMITDVAQRFDSELEWTSLLHDFSLPESSDSWIWEIAPPHEHGMPERGSERRRVEAFVL